MFDFLLIPLGWILKQISYLFSGNYAMTVFVFTVLINVVMIPLSIKSQKSSMGQTRLKPKLEALRQKYGNDRQKFAMAQQELMQQEGVSMSGGCLPMLIRMPIMIGIYSVIQSPLRYLTNLSTETVTALQDAFTKLPEAVRTEYLQGNSTYAQPAIISAIKAGELNVGEAEQAAIKALDFDFFGIDLTKTPHFNIDIFGGGWQPEWWIPILAFAAAMLTSIASMIMQKKNNPEAPSMGALMLSMPLISLFIGFTLPCAAGFYWACSSLVSGIIQIVLQNFYGPNQMVANEQKKELLARYEIEKKKLKGKTE